MVREYWDTCLFLAYLQNKTEEKNLVEIVSALLRRAENGEALIVVSTLVVAEIRPGSTYNPDHYEVVRELFYTGPLLSEDGSAIAVHCQFSEYYR